MKFAEKMCLMTILKVKKKKRKGFPLHLRINIFHKTTVGEIESHQAVFSVIHNIVIFYFHS